MDSSNSLSDLTKLAFQFGPFFFALLFVLGISRWAYKKYDTAKEPDKRKTNKQVYISIMAFGILLVVISVIWWWKYQPTLFVFKGEIKNLKEYERISSNNLFLKSNWSGKLTQDIGQLHDDEFIIIQDKPFKDKQPFEIRFVKGTTELQNFIITYSQEDSPCQYEILFDTIQGKNVIKKQFDLISDNHGFSLFNQAYAQTTNNQKISSVNWNESNHIKEEADDKLIKILQDEYTDAGSKIKALNQMKTLDNDELHKIINKKTAKENMTLTLLDLTYNSDLEISYTSKELIKKINLNQSLATQLSSKNRMEVEEAKKIISRVDKNRAIQIFNLSDTLQPEIKRFKKSIQKNKAPTIPIATATLNGDRYYVKAVWDKENKNTTECLTELFNKELVSNRTLKEEAQLMSGRSTRLIYWYSKTWALNMAEKIRECGGVASFVTAN